MIISINCERDQTTGDWYDAGPYDLHMHEKEETEQKQAEEEEQWG